MTTLLDPAVVASPPALVAHAGPGADTAASFGKDRNWASVLWSFYGTFLTALEVELNLGDPKVSAPVYARRGMPHDYPWQRPEWGGGDTTSDAAVR